MAALLVLALSVGLVDSANPSTVGPALYLAAGRHGARSVALFIVGVFAVYAAGGVVLALGPGQAALALLPHPDHRVVHVLELVFGAGAVVLAGLLWRGRAHVAERLTRRTGAAPRTPRRRGAGIMIVELPTAFPYFAVIAAVVGSGIGIASQLIVLLVFNAAFIAPLAAVFALRAAAGERGAHVLESWRASVDERGPVVLAALVLAIGVGLVAVGLLGLT